MDILETKTKVLRVADLRPNEGQMEAIGVHTNPRQISEVEYQKLLDSLRTDNLTGVLQEKVFNYEGEWIVLDGNMRLRALQELGVEKVQCTIVPEDTPAKVIKKIIILSNATFGEWDMDALANWDEPLADWGVDVPEYGDPSVLLDEANFESLNEIARDKTNMTQITFLFKKDEAEQINEYCKANGKQFLAQKIVDICQQPEAK